MLVIIYLYIRAWVAEQFKVQTIGINNVWGTVLCTFLESCGLRGSQKIPRYLGHVQSSSIGRNIGTCAPAGWVGMILGSEPWICAPSSNTNTWCFINMCVTKYCICVYIESELGRMCQTLGVGWTQENNLFKN